MPIRVPARLPDGLLVKVAREQGLLLCLDYDGTLAEIAPEPAAARPFPGVVEQLLHLRQARDRLRVAIVTGRRIYEVKAALRINSGLFFSGVHGLELDVAGGQPYFVQDALNYAPALDRVRQWLLRQVPESRGFIVEDKQYALGLHYRLAEANEAAALCGRFSQFVAWAAPQLKVLRLKMLVEAVPKAASKAHAITGLKALMPAGFVTAYLGDDATDEDGFSALSREDLGILVDSPRVSCAKYRLDGPAEVVRELGLLAKAL